MANPEEDQTPQYNTTVYVVALDDKGTLSGVFATESDANQCAYDAPYMATVYPFEVVGAWDIILEQDMEDAIEAFLSEDNV